MKKFIDYNNFTNIALNEITDENGDIIWNDADINTPWVQDILSEYASSNNIDIIDVMNDFNTKKQQMTDYLNETPMMSDIAVQGVVEQILFEFLPDVSKEKFTLRILKDLFTAIEGTYSRYGVLKDGSTGKFMYPSIYITPSIAPQPDWMKGVTTAAASATADIIFNRDFAKKLIYYARMKSIKGSAKFYVSNGGTIPDEYVYIEFLIMHELAHVVHGDMNLWTPILERKLCRNKDKYKKILMKFGWNGTDGL